jgi:sugar O-acyltransferase (sialic acid O-acetyltransferase NeuD family)
MKHLVIIGARGAGREVYETALATLEYENHEYDIKGFLDDKNDALDATPGYPPILSSVENYAIQQDDVFVCALGNPIWRKRYADIILDKGGIFISVIDRSARIGRNSIVGKGCIIRRLAEISCDVNIGDFSYIQPYAAIGHDAIIGKYCHVNAYGFMGGYSVMGDFSTIETKATLLPHKRVGERAVLGANSVAIRNIKNDTVVFGLPATEI